MRKGDKWELSEKDQYHVESGQNLSPDMIDSVCNVLGLQIQPVVIHSGKQYSLCTISSQKFVQVLSLSESSSIETHCVVVSSVFSEADTVSIYDSFIKLHFDRRDGKRIQYPDSLLKHIQSLMRFTGRTVTQQNCSSESGVYSLLIAKALFENIDPCTVVVS